MALYIGQVRTTQAQPIAHSNGWRGPAAERDGKKRVP
jgi:hypothetical protein